MEFETINVDLELANQGAEDSNLVRTLKKIDARPIVDNGKRNVKIFIRNGQNCILVTETYEDNPNASRSWVEKVPYTVPKSVLLDTIVPKY